MHRPRFAGPLETDVTITDFELVRNEGGQWLLVLPDLPSSIADNPLAELCARLDDDTLLLEAPGVRLNFSSLVSKNYAQALRSDRPQDLMLCVVDDEGMRTYARVLPVEV